MQNVIIISTNVTIVLAFCPIQKGVMFPVLTAPTVWSDMAPFTTLEMRKTMVYWRFEEHMTALQISILAGCSDRTVYEVLWLHRDYGQVTYPFTRSRGRPHVLENGDVEYIHALLQANPVLYLDELQEQHLSVWDKDISLASLSRAICRLAMTHRRISKPSKIIWKWGWGAHQGGTAQTDHAQQGRWLWNQCKKCLWGQWFRK